MKIGAYSVVREVLHDALLPAFAENWKRKTGREVRFEESYSGSGAQARAIASGFDADIAILSHPGDMKLLVEAGRVNPDWDSRAHSGIITNSLVVIGTRSGNPKGIKDWADLATPGVGVLYADPRTSGGARWNINAIYGAALAQPGQADETEQTRARELLAKIQANVINMDPSARQSMASFQRGIGDAIITYENELLLLRKKGEEVSYVVPPATLLIEGPAAIVQTSVEQHGNRELAEAFLAFLQSPEGQAIFAEYGFRPVDDNAATDRLPQLERLFTMADLGGWDVIEEQLYGPKGLWTSISGRQTRGR